MTTEGIEAVFLETRNWGKAAKFFQALGLVTSVKGLGRVRVVGQGDDGCTDGTHPVLVRHARLVTYPGMGHDLPIALWPSILDEICARAGQDRAGSEYRVNVDRERRG